MTLDDALIGPGRETSPAFVLPPKRQFDGGLVQRWPYALTRAEALAWLRLHRKWSGRGKMALGGVCFAGGAVWALSPWGDAGPLALLATESGLIAAVFAGRDLWWRLAAWRMVPCPRPGVLEEWLDCIAATEVDSTDEAYLSPELIGEVVLTRRHLIIRSHATTLVVPRHAFAGAAEAEAVAAHLRDLAAGPYYFDAPLDAPAP